ncbi:ornithine cyclodeaminase [Kiloniella laminariae]|uniref:ornithine cyclodeaminase n=1 Tax=Kiloniella laminariae TaxID=454162 RepID=UPI000527CB0B|nr:ornithine cyclodeaminase [Kiloniella laminariae]
MKKRSPQFSPQLSPQFSQGQQNQVPFVSVEHMTKIILAQGIETFLSELTGYIEDDYKRWMLFDKTPRVASHSQEGVVELMPTSDGEIYSFKYVNGHPKNSKKGLQTVTAFGALSDVGSGYPVLLSEMTILTALRTAATSALAAKHLVLGGEEKTGSSLTMAIIGNGAQSEFQALGFRAVLGIEKLRLYDIDGTATDKCADNLEKLGFQIVRCNSVEDVVLGADIITTVTADKQNATILTDNMVGAGVYINAVGGDCPGKTELHRDILLRADIFAEYLPQTRIEGEIQQLDADHPVTELWEIIQGKSDWKKGRKNVVLFDSVGFAIEDFSALRYVKDLLLKTDHFQLLDMIAEPEDPRNLYGLLQRSHQSAA